MSILVDQWIWWMFNALLKLLLNCWKLKFWSLTFHTSNRKVIFFFFSSMHTSHLENSWLSPIRRKWRLTFGATGGHIYYEWRGGVDPLCCCKAWIYNSKRERPLRHNVYDTSIWYWCTLKCKQAQKAGGMQCCPHHLLVCCWGGKVAY